MAEKGLSVIDLFAGMGGLSKGFQRAGFAVTGVDIEKWTEDIFTLNNTGNAVIADLSKEIVFRDVPVVIGGPPCRPWSCVNLSRRENHPDIPLLGRFFRHIQEIKPEIFLMENVPLLRKDGVYQKWLRWAGRNDYNVASQIVRYSDYGAPTSRHRLFTVGVRESDTGAEDFFARLKGRRKPPVSVEKAIYWLRLVPSGGYPDHVWPNLQTISRYAEYYESGKYGWYRLNYIEPAPSFGNIMKTYILHPEAGCNGIPLRVISVREALSIMGFGRKFRFPEKVPLRKKYQMVADAVSPVFSRICAKIIREMLG